MAEAAASTAGEGEGAGEGGRREMLEEVRSGLSRPQKKLSSKYFYDERGSRLFERITRLQEYYLTRAEQALLDEHIPGWEAEMRPRALVELGAGNAEKTRTVIDAMLAASGSAVYVPVDVSEDFLHETAAVLEREYASLRVTPAVSDISREFRLPPLPSPVLHAFLGSTIGNFAEAEATKLLARVAGTMAAGDRLLLGADLSDKPSETIEAAYNDAEGVTAEFNLNILSVINRELGADFRLQDFRHRAVWVADRSRIEMHLVARRDLTVSIPGMDPVRFRDGETVRTEISGKFDRPALDRMLAAAGLEVARWAVHPEACYALLLARPAAP
jgi:L-histidine Nalpha-methyltransferase